MKFHNFLLAGLLMALPVTGAFAQGGTAPDISVKESKEWAKANNTPAKKAHHKTTKAKAMSPKSGIGTAGSAGQTVNPSAK